MITREDLLILSDDEYIQEEGNFCIKEISKDKTNKFIMDLNVKINDHTFYRIFLKKGSSDQDEDHCKLRFLRHLSFPDGIFLEVSNEKIKCHVFELKKKPVSKLSKIKKQFMSAKFHLISLFSIIGIDFNEVEIQYYVCFVDDIEPIDKYNQRNPKKIIPGQKMSSPTAVSDWLEGKIEFELGKHKFSESVSKIQMDFIEEDDKKFKVYKQDYTIA